MVDSSPAGVPRLAVVGVGWWSTAYHLPAVADTDRAALVAVVDTHKARRDAASKRYDVPAYPSLTELIRAGAPDGVLVTVPHDAHHALTVEALEAGLHVFLEKPMTLTSREAWDLVERARRKDLHLMLGYTHQVTRLASRLRATIVGGELGELVHVAALSATMLEPLLRGRPDEVLDALGNPEVSPPSDTYSRPGSGGQALSQLTHATGFVCHVTDLQPLEVAAVMNHRGLEVDVSDAISVRFSSGATATLSSTGSVRPGHPEQQELRFYGSRGYALVDLLQGILEIGSDHGTERLELPAEEICPPLEPARRFGDLIAGRADNPAPPVPAARAVEIIEAAHRSSAQRRTIGVAELVRVP